MAKSSFRRAPITVKVSGVPEVAKVLETIGRTTGASVERRLARGALAAGGKPLKKAIKREVPTRSRYRVVGKRKKRAATTNTLRKSIGFRNNRNRRSGQHEAKAGVNVANTYSARRHPHLHLLALGTKRRYTGARTWRNKSGPRSRRTGKPRQYRGYLEPDSFVARGVAISRGAVSQAMLYYIRRRLPVEVEKLRRRNAVKVQG